MLLAHEFIELGDAASVPGPAERRALSHTRELFLGTELQRNICRSRRADTALTRFQPSARPAKPTALLDRKNREVSQQEGCRARTAGEEGTATTCTNRRGESAQSQMPHRVSGETFVFCGLFFPSCPPPCVLCQTLIPGVMHHVVINHTWRVTGLPVAPMCKSQGSLGSTQQPAQQSPSWYPGSCESRPSPGVTSSSKILMCNCHFYCLNLE